MPDLALATQPECYQIQAHLYLLLSPEFPFPYAQVAGIRRMPQEVSVTASGMALGPHQNDYQGAADKGDEWMLW